MWRLVPKPAICPLGKTNGRHIYLQGVRNFQWHIPQIIEEVFFRSDCQLVENCPQLVILPTANVNRDSIALSWGSREVEPVCIRELHDTIFQVGESHFVLVFGWHVVLHGGVADLCEGQLPTEATLVKGHSFGAVAIKK